MAGVINLRGSVVPVVDLRLCFEMSKTESTRNTCIVVVEVLLDNESTVIGALGRFGRRGDRPGAGADSAGAAHRHPDPDRFHQGDGQARHAVHHDSGHRPRLLGRGACRGRAQEPARKPGKQLGRKWPRKEGSGAGSSFGADEV
jgi:hypothetical protein